MINPVSGHYQSDHDLLSDMAVFEEYLDDCRNVVGRGRLPRLSRDQAFDLFRRIVGVVPVRDTVDREWQAFLARYPGWVDRAIAAAEDEKRRRRALVSHPLGDGDTGDLERFNEAWKHTIAAVPGWSEGLIQALRQLWTLRNGMSGRELTQAEVAALIALREAFGERERAVVV